MGAKPAALLTTLTLVSGFAVACSSAPPPPAQTETKTVTVTVATPAAPPPSASPNTDTPAAGIGDEAIDGNLAFTVTRVDPVTQGGQLGVYLTVKNVGSSAPSYVADYQKLVDVDGREFSVDIHAMAGSSNPLAVTRTDMNPGIELKAGLVFNVPSDIKPAHLVLHESMYSRGAVVNLS